MITQNTLPIGLTLQEGKYIINTILGRGGFGITYKAQHSSLKRHVAIKEFFPVNFCKRDEQSSKLSLFTEDYADIVDKLKRKFIREAQHIASLEHENIIRIHDIFEENGTAYYVMEYIEGASLYEIVKREGALKIKDAIPIIKGIGNALDYIHCKKIGHYDVKPGNIMVRSNNNTPVLIDFGLSKHFSEGDSNSTTSSIIGHSNGYAPVEQYNSSEKIEFSSTTDLYSLTATLFFVLSGITPPVSTTLINSQIQIPTIISQKYWPILKKGLSIKQSKRYQTAKELISAIDKVEKKTLIEVLSEKTSQLVAKVKGTITRTDKIEVVSVISDEPTLIDSKQTISVDSTELPEQKRKALFKHIVMLVWAIIIVLSNWCIFNERCRHDLEHRYFGIVLTILTIIEELIIYIEINKNKGFPHSQKRIIAFVYALWFTHLLLDRSIYNNVIEVVFGLILYLTGIVLFYLFYKLSNVYKAVVACFATLIISLIVLYSR